MAVNNAFAYQNPYLANGYYYPQAPVFQPYNYPMQGQNQMPQQTQQNQSQAQFTNVWFNGGENEARMYPVAPNNAVALWSETDPIIYLKKADASGKPEFKVYDLVERKQETGEISYASKDDMSSLIGIVKDLSNTVGSLKTDIETMKGDVYGLAGKKKLAVKKTEVDEDV
jgi:hypothetical protein